MNLSLDDKIYMKFEIVKNEINMIWIEFSLLLLVHFIRIFISKYFDFIQLKIFIFFSKSSFNSLDSDVRLERSVPWLGVPRWSFLKVKSSTGENVNVQNQSNINIGFEYQCFHIFVNLCSWEKVNLTWSYTL